MGDWKVNRGRMSMRSKYVNPSPNVPDLRSPISDSVKIPLNPTVLSSLGTRLTFANSDSLHAARTTWESILGYQSSTNTDRYPGKYPIVLSADTSISSREARARGSRWHALCSSIPGVMLPACQQSRMTIIWCLLEREIAERIELNSRSLMSGMVTPFSSSISRSIGHSASMEPAPAIDTVVLGESSCK